MRKFLQLCSLLTLISCVTGTVPTMQRKIKVWNGSPEEVGICRMSTKTLAPKIGSVPFILKSFHKGTSRPGLECLGAHEEQFKQYACLTFEDLGVLYDYIETLIYQCQKWPK